MNVQSIYLVSEKFELPKISKEEVAALAKRIKPTIRSAEGQLSYIKEFDNVDDMFKKSFTWEPEVTEPADDLVEVDRTFFLSTGYPAMWKPTISEVFAFIQDMPNIDLICAFETDYISQHKTGEGSIGRVKLYMKA